MAENINLRLYGEQIYPTISKYLSEYISPEIQKEEFLEKYKNGSVEIKDISLKKKVEFNSQLKIDSASIGELKFHIPNETENFAININNMKCLLIISDIKEEYIETILRENKKQLINDFITYSITKIEKKDGVSFLDNLLKNFINKIINGISIEINNLELKVKTDNGKNTSFVFIIEKFIYSDEKGIKIKNISIIYEEDLIKINVIDKFDFDIDIINSNEEGKSNQFNLSISDFKFELNKNIYFEFLNYWQLFDNAQYKKTYIKYKKLIQYHRPKLIEGKKDYKSLWYYAIKTVIKLQKYIKYNKTEIFDLLESSQIKIIKKYINDENVDDDKFLLPDDKNSLKATKEKVEKKVLDNKKGNVLANAFSFFFGAKKEEENNELTEEEKEISDEIYQDSNIINYLNGNLDNNKNTSLTSIIDKIKQFLSNISIHINIAKLELILNNVNIGNKQNLFIKGMRMNVNYINKELDFNYVIDDIGYEKNKSFFAQKELFVSALEFKRDKNNFVNLSFGFKNIELNEDLFMCLLTFFKSIQTKSKQKLFKEKKYNNIVEKKDKDEKENEVIQNIKNFSFMNNFKLSNIPSFSIKCKDNKIQIKVINYSMTENSLSFTVNIKDSYGEILKDFTFNPTKDNNNFIFHLDSPLNINLSNKSTKSFFLNYLRYKKELSTNNTDKNKMNNKQKKEEELFGFNYTSYKSIDIGNLDMNNYTLDIIINQIKITIFEEEQNYESSLIIDQLKFLYQKKSLNISLEQFIIKTNLMSTMILYFLDFESPLFADYKKKLNFKTGDINDFFSISSQNLESINKNENELDIKNEFDYGTLLKEILNEFNFKLNFLSFIFQANNLTISLNFSNIISNKNQTIKDLNATFDNWNLEIKSPKFKYKNKKILDNSKKTTMIYKIDTDIIKGKMESVYFNTNLQEVVEIWDNLSFLLNQINWDIILCKMDIKVDDFVLIFDQFKYSISKIFFINFKEGKTNNDTFYFKLLEFVMTNQNGDKLIYEKELYIDYIFTSSNENDVIIKFNNVSIQLSQHDISFLLLCIKLPENKEDLPLKKAISEMPDFNSDNTIKKVDLLGFEEVKSPGKDKHNIMHSKITMQDAKKELRKKFQIKAEIKIPKLNLCFCLNDYTKQSEFLVESSTIKIQSLILENIIDKEISNELTYSLLLGQLNFKDFSNKDNEYTILTKRKVNIDDNKNTIKNDINDIENKNNQIEIICNNNGYTINMNENEINARIDSLLLIYYYFKGAIPIDEVIDNLEQADFNANNYKKNKNLSFQINFNNSQFQLCTSFDEKENLYLDIKNFTIIYNCNLDGKIPYGSYMITLSKMSAKIASKNNIRDIFFTSDNFLLFKIDYSSELFSSNIILDTLTINLSYRDLLSFLRVYTINMKKYNNITKKSEEYLKNLELNKTKKISNNNNQNKIKSNNYKQTKTGTPTGNNNKNKLCFTGDFNFEKLDITLIDNSKGSYHPFMNIINDKIYLVLNPNNFIETTFNLSLFSYNYIACLWEPTIEKTSIKANNIYRIENAGINNRLKMEINSMSINLSDMAISFTLLTFNNWLRKLEQKQKNFEIEEMKSSKNNITKQNGHKNITKITNNQVINYTGIEMKIIHNGKEIACPPLKEIELDYIKEYNKSKKVVKHITLIYDKEHKFEIPLEKIVTLRHIINNDLSIISENTISENRSINIYLYSPIIFKNKSIYPLQIKIENPNFDNTFLVLNPNTITGLPLSLVNKETIFNFMLINTKPAKNNENINEDYSENYNLDKILNINTDTVYKKQIKFKKKSFIMKLEHKTTNVRTLIINTEYSIINCLPCDIVIRFSDKQLIIKKCTQYYIDNNTKTDLFVAFTIKTKEGLFTSEGINILNLGSNNEGNYIEFKNKKEILVLKYYFKKNEEENTLMIYSDYILYNNSGIVLSIYSKNINNRFIYQVDDNISLISLISNKNDYKEANIQFFNEHYISPKINFSKLIESTSYLQIRMDNNEVRDFLKLNIKKKFSFISIINNPNFKENIGSTIFSILPSCRIINLLSSQRFFICDNNYRSNYTIIGPLEKQCFHFYGKGVSTDLGISVLNLKSNTVTHIIKFHFKMGIYTLSTGEYTFNLEIRKNPSDGCIDVFVIENDIDNSQILLENVSDEGINIYQNGFEKYMQIISPKEIQTLKIFNYENPDYMIETNNSCICIRFDINSEQEKRIKLNKKIIAIIQSNGIKMKITFYLIDVFNKLKSSSINNYYSINITNILLSIVGDNEFQNKELNNYQRNELLLFVFNNLVLTFNVEKTMGILDKDFIQYNIMLNDCSIYNQKSDIGQFSCILYNETPFLSLYGEIDYYQKFKIIKTKKQNFLVGKLRLGIDPEFIIDLLDFWDNILYRMDITYFNVHEIFINQEKQKENTKNNNDKKYDQLIEEYDQSRILLNAKDFYFPELYMKFEITNKDLKKLLKERIDCSDFYIWLAKGLVGRKHTLILEKSPEPYNNGGVGLFFKNMYYICQDKLEYQLTDIGLKGFVGQFKNMFKVDETVKDNVQKNRFRQPRAFYGRFKYFQVYNQVEAYLINNIFDKNKFLKNKYYPVNTISGPKTVYLFTTLSMFLASQNTFDLFGNVDYYSIKKVESEKNFIIVTYNQIIDSKEQCKIKCEDEDIAKKVAKTLIEEAINNKENIFEL